ncbi:MAG: MucB/RseB C-terminal domain-containing protein [Cocleimonas sp.]|nr:MucB/RseB C-terminal domain-containing protein [Cocleimonas sp.]
MNTSLKYPSLKSFTKVNGLVVVLSLFLTPAVYADEAAVELLNRMNRALHELNYNGTLAYLKGDALSSLHIEHSVRNGVKTERVVRLNEEGNEVSRELQGFSLASIPRISPEMNAVYSFDMGRENRIANISCRIITARPKDRKRYLQKYCIDTKTGMLLDYMLVGKSHKPVEQFMFTSIKISLPEKSIEEPLVKNKDSQVVISNVPTEIANQVVAPVIATKDSSVMPVKISAKKLTSVLQEKSILRQLPNTNLDDGWVMESLPVGFEIMQAPSMKPSKVRGDETKHYVVSDGLSSLSVFVSPLTSVDAGIGSVKINSGALNVVTQEKNDHIITVVGEVPESTLRNIINNLQKK